MRASLFLVSVLLVTLFSASSASAAATFTDPVGDVVAEPAGSTVPDNAQVQNTDLIGLDVIEGEHDWTFTVLVASLDQRGGTINTYTTEFTWDDATYRVSMLRSRLDPTSEPLLRGQLQLADGAAWNRIMDLEIKESGNTLSVTFEKLYIVSLDGHAPVPGSELTGILVTSRSDANFGNALPVQLVDTLVAGTSVTYTKGGTATGHIVLEPADPVRISNGGSGTFVYTVHIQNRGDTDDDVKLTLMDIPEGWTARVHPQYRIPSKEETPVLVVATLPFGHTHGGFSALTLHAESLSTPSAQASVKLGVVHTPIPQPAGHHSEVFLHSVPADTGVFGTALPGSINTMNTLAGHGDDLAEAYPDRDFQTGAQQPSLLWRINLGPQLAMGLDFDLDRTGTLEGTLIGRTTGQGALAAELWLIQGDRDIMLLASAPAAALTLDMQAASPFSAVVTPTPESDYVRYAPGQNLQLRLSLTTETPCCPPQGGPTLPVEAFRMTLPLNEYHEAPAINEEAGPIVATLQATALGPIEKRARAGTTVTYLFDVTNGGTQAEEVNIEVEGGAKDHVSVAPSLAFTLQPGGAIRLVLGVKVPPGTNDGEVLDAILLIRSATAPANVAIARTSTVVTSGSDAVADESDVLANAQGGETKSTPFPTGAALFFALAGAALLVARRNPSRERAPPRK